ncbi:MAG: pseudouridine-5'-phosphate glycosidase [Alphaproteobacteria bacterium]|nr:pseudouridine-5'-phosphate glycosidase [Alphaproteobacteria bacterium]
MKLNFNAEVNVALDAGRPVVALESTIISHGLPYPENLAVARQLEDTVREEGATPATIAVIGGEVQIGLDEDSLMRLAAAGGNIRKLSRRDLPQILALGGDGATTVAATMILAEKAGIRVFATGGIGGVHRGAENSLDISADLPELAQTSVAVVSAGPKAILDIALTLEVLETSGVPVIGYQTNDMPAFWSRQSGHQLDDRVDTPAQIARIMAMKWQSRLDGGVLVANPVPAEHEIPADDINGFIDAALKAADDEGITGKAVTPFLLDHIRRMTDGRSLATNMALVVNNARLAAKIACAYAELA